MSIIFFSAFIGIVIALGNAAGVWAVPVLVVWLMFAPLAVLALCLVIGLAVVLNELRKDEAETFHTAMDRVAVRQQAKVDEAVAARIRARNSARIHNK